MREEFKRHFRSGVWKTKTSKEIRMSLTDLQQQQLLRYPLGD